MNGFCVYRIPPERLDHVVHHDGNLMGEETDVQIGAMSVCSAVLFNVCQPCTQLIRHETIAQNKQDNGDHILDGSFEVSNSLRKNNQQFLVAQSFMIWV